MSRNSASDSRRSHRYRGSARLVLFAASLAAAYGAGALVERYRAAMHDEWSDTRLLSLAIDSVRVNALDSLPSDELIRRAVSGMLRELRDPYAELLQTDGIKRYRGSLLGESSDLGISLRGQARDSSFVVVSVVRGSPAQLAGIRIGDRILLIDGKSPSEIWNRDRDSSAVAPRQSVMSVWRPATSDTLVLLVSRRAWHRSAIADQGLLSDSVGYVRLKSMTARSSDELERSIEELVDRGARSLVIDLRENGGGLFEEGVKAAGLFLPRGVIAASLAGRGGMPSKPYRVVTSRWPLMPLVVLVDGGTASAAEVLAAALRDHQRALLIGAPTYGKGVVQRVVNLTPDLSLRLTTARWLPPGGEVLVRREGAGSNATGGIRPDVLVDDASRRDGSWAPSHWKRDVADRIGILADSIALQALAEGWAISPLAMLEARIRMAIASDISRGMMHGLPDGPASESMRSEWIAGGTRMAVMRALEMDQAEELRLRLNLDVDGALRAAFETLTPGSAPAVVVPSTLSDRSLR